MRSGGYRSYMECPACSVSTTEENQSNGWNQQSSLEIWLQINKSKEVHEVFLFGFWPVCVYIYIYDICIKHTHIYIYIHDVCYIYTIRTIIGTHPFGCLVSWNSVSLWSIWMVPLCSTDSTRKVGYPQLATICQPQRLFFVSFSIHDLPPLLVEKSFRICSGELQCLHWTKESRHLIHKNMVSKFILKISVIIWWHSETCPGHSPVAMSKKCTWGNTSSGNSTNFSHSIGTGRVSWKKYGKTC